MKSIPSSLFFKEKPIPKGMDVALLFALENYTAITEHYARLQKSLLAVNQQEGELENEKYWLYPAIVCVLGLGLGIFLSKYLLVIIAAGLVWFYMSYTTHKKQLDAVGAEKARLSAELNNKMPQLVKRIGSVNYCAEVLPFADGTIVSDASGMLENTSINLSLINNCESRVNELMELKAGLTRDFPILLPPGTENEHTDTVYLTGIEKNVEDMLSLLDKLITDSEDVVINMPVYQNGDKIPAIINDLQNRFSDKRNGLISVTTSIDRSEIIARLSLSNFEVELARKFGYQNIENLLRSVYNDVEDLSRSLTENRNYAVNDLLLKSVSEIENIYDFPLTRFYNPRLSGSKQLENKVRNYEGDDFDRIEPAEFEAFYKKNDMLKLRDVQSKVKGMIIDMEDNEKITNDELNHYLKKRYDNYAELIRDLSLEISPEEEEEYTKHYKNAVLNYNVFKRKWICQLTNEEYTEEEALKSRILKIKEDLITPLWDKLWLEKHDEKVRIIREKELELRENKKLENSEMREEVKIFTEELRPIRNKLEERAISAKTGENKLKLSIDFYTSEGILAQGALNKMKAKFTTDSVKIETVFETADSMEANLEKEPEGVMMLRGELKDYTLEVRNKEKFFLPQK